MKPIGFLAIAFGLLLSLAPSARAQDAEAAQRLWQVSEDLVGSGTPAQG